MTWKRVLNTWITQGASGREYRIRKWHWGITMRVAERAGAGGFFVGNFQRVSRAKRYAALVERGERTIEQARDRGASCQLRGLGKPHFEIEE